MEEEPKNNDDHYHEQQQVEQPFGSHVFLSFFTE